MITIGTAQKHQAKIKSLVEQLNSAIVEANELNVITEIEIFQMSDLNRYCDIVQVKISIDPREIGE